MYIGSTTAEYRPLFSRLRHHQEDLTKTPLWETFSWFGFREVQDDGSLKELEDTSLIPVKSLITMIETVAIEACFPRLNGQRGQLLGTIYEQVPDPDLTNL